MIAETLLSLVTRVCHLKHLFHRVKPYLTSHLAYVAALFNLLLALTVALSRMRPPMIVCSRSLTLLYELAPFVR
jgi:hypothetical protein